MRKHAKFMTASVPNPFLCTVLLGREGEKFQMVNMSSKNMPEPCDKVSNLVKEDLCQQLVCLNFQPQLKRTKFAADEFKKQHHPH